MMPACEALVQEARHERRDDGSLALHVNGVSIRQTRDGDVEVDCRPRHIRCSPRSGFAHVHTPAVDIAVQVGGGDGSRLD